MKRALVFFLAISLLIAACNESEQQAAQKTDTITALPTTEYCTTGIPQRFPVDPVNSEIKKGIGNNAGMVWIPSSPNLRGFYMDTTEVTNAAFAKFVKQTKYVTTAERIPDWEELRKQLPPGTPKPPDSLLVAASLVFSSLGKKVNMSNPGAWWIWKKGANWKHPQGALSTIKGKEQYPVVQLSWDDALAYCKWAGKRLPTAAEWEAAAKGGMENAKYPWGNEDIDQGKVKANTWQGIFPTENTKRDGVYGLAATASFPPNHYGLYDMAGNVWEWCSDDSNGEKVVKGGSFLCNATYCEGYRIDSKMTSSKDTSLEHTGFRCVK
ncbi:SUMF1/EgtB/PvdO family nonheme iron enzyme [Pedobacter sp. PWIIR3]